MKSCNLYSKFYPHTKYSAEITQNGNAVVEQLYLYYPANHKTPKL